MNILRVLVLIVCLFCVQNARALPSPSARRIAPVEMGYAESMEVSRDGRFLCVVSLPGEKGSNCIIIDRRSHQTTQLSASDRMEPLGFSRDGRCLWVWGLHLDEPMRGLKFLPRDEPFIALYDLRRKRYLRAWFGSGEDSKVPADGVLSRDGRTLIYATQDGFVCGFDTRTGRVKWRRRAQDKGDEPVSLELSGDGSKFLRTSDDENGQSQSAEVVSTRSGRILTTLRLPFEHRGAMSAFSGAKFAPRGSQVAVFKSDSQQWVFFNSVTAKTQWKMGGPSRSSEGDLKWQWSPNARYVGVSGPGGFEVRDAKNGRVIERCAEMSGLVLAFSPDGSRIYALQDNKTGFDGIKAERKTMLWQWRLFPSRRQHRADARFMQRLRAEEERFALSPPHLNQSLLIAARSGNFRRVAMLLDRGASIETLNGSRETPLQNAINGSGAYPRPQHSYETAKLLIERGANIKKHGGLLLASAAETRGPLLALLIAHGANVNSDRYPFGANTALHTAARKKQLANVQLLLRCGARVNARGEDGATPLFNSVQSIEIQPVNDQARQAIARMLLQRGADINAATLDGMDKGATPLIIAAKNVDLPMMRYLLSHGAKLESRDSQGCTALMRAAWSFRPEDQYPDPHAENQAIAAIKLLAARGAGLNVRTDSGVTAFSGSSSPVIRAALKKLGAA